MGGWGRFLFGQVRFRDSEEYLAFQFRFLIAVLISGALCTALFLLGVESGMNPMTPLHVRSMKIFTLMALLLWLVLRGHKERYYPVAWAYAALCMLEYVSALIFVSEDELRVLWFLVNIPGVYILLGPRAGLLLTGLSVVGLALGNAHLDAPYSPNAMATLLISMVYLSIFFHVYGVRSISYFVRMRESNEKLRHMATHDTLTGLLNARAYYSACDHLIRLAKRNGVPYAVLFADLDHFKSINDTYGHGAGDLVLKTVAARLAASVRDSDVLGRIGGEEFSIFLPGTDAEAARNIAEEIRKSIESLMPQVERQAIRVTVSLGVAGHLDAGGGAMQDIQQRADQAMYLAKARGRNRVSSFGEVLGAESLPA